jgi:hypothetical protein
VTLAQMSINGETGAIANFLPKIVKSLFLHQVQNLTDNKNK